MTREKYMNFKLSLLTAQPHSLIYVLSVVALGQQGQSLNMGGFSLVGAVPEHPANHGELSCNCVCFVHTMTCY